MKNKTLFFILNALLVAIVGVIIGLTCSSHIFVNGAGVSAFVCLLIVLCLPSLIYVEADKLKVGGLIATILFVVAEIVLSIIFLVKPSFGVSPYWISQAAVIGSFLIAGLIIVASKRKPVESK